MNLFGQLLCEAKPQMDLRLKSPNCEMKGIKGSVFSPNMINMGFSAPGSHGYTVQMSSGADQISLWEWNPWRTVKWYSLFPRGLRVPWGAAAWKSRESSYSVLALYLAMVERVHGVSGGWVVQCGCSKVLWLVFFIHWCSQWCSRVTCLFQASISPCSSNWANDSDLLFVKQKEKDQQNTGAYLLSLLKWWAMPLCSTSKRLCS